MDYNEELTEAKYEYDKAVRLRDNLQKNYDRRKKLNLLDEDGERDLLNDLSKATENMNYLKRKMNSIESQMSRSKLIGSRPYN